MSQHRRSKRALTSNDWDMEEETISRCNLASSLDGIFDEIDNSVMKKTKSRKRPKRAVQQPLNTTSELNNKTEDEWNSLTMSARYGHVKVVRRLLCRNCDVEFKDENGSTALQLAAMYGHADVVEELLAENCQVDSVDEAGSTALNLAAMYNHSEIVKQLLRSKCNAEIANTEGWTAIHFAARSGYIEVLEQLLRAKCDVNVTNKDGWTALILAARYRQYHVVARLLKHGCLLNIASKSGWTALHLASHHRYPDVVKLLLDSNCKVDLVNKSGMTALHLAVVAGNEIIVQQLLEHGAKVGISDEDGDTALHKAARKGRKLTIMELVKAGADMLVKNKAGKTPMCLGGGFYIRLLFHDLYIQYQTNKLEQLWVRAQHSAISHVDLVSCLQASNITSFTCFFVAHNLFLLAIRKRVFDCKQIQGFGGSPDFLLKQVYLPASTLELTHSQRVLLCRMIADAEKLGFIPGRNKALVKLAADLEAEAQNSALSLQTANIKMARDLHFLRDHHSSGEWVWKDGKSDEFHELSCNSEHVYELMKEFDMSLNKLDSSMKENSETMIIEAVTAFCLTFIPVALGSLKSHPSYPRGKNCASPGSEASCLPIVDFSNIWNAVALTNKEFIMKLEPVCRNRLECVVTYSEFKTLPQLHSRIRLTIDELEFINLTEKEDEGKTKMRQRFRALASSADMDTISAQIAIRELEDYLDKRFSPDANRLNNVTTTVVDLIDEHCRIGPEAFSSALRDLEDMYSVQETRRKAQNELVKRFRKAAAPDKKLLTVIAKAVLSRIVQESKENDSFKARRTSLKQTHVEWNDSLVGEAFKEYDVNESYIDEEHFIKASMNNLFSDQVC